MAGAKWLKVRQIAQELYGGDMAKASAVAQRREAQGKYRVDPDFPDDKGERRCSTHWQDFPRQLAVELACPPSTISERQVLRHGQQ